MIRPRGRVCLLAAAVAFLALASETATFLAPGWIAAAAALTVLASAADLILAARRALPAMRREVPAQCAYGRPTAIQVHLANTQRAPMHLDFQETPPSETAARLEPASQQILLPAGQCASFEYLLTAQTRGPLLLDRCQLHLSGPLGLWSIRRSLSLPQRTLAGADLGRLAAQTRSGVDQALAAAVAAQPGSPGMRTGELVIWLDTPPGLASAWRGVKGLDQAKDIALAVANLALTLGGRCGLQLDPGQRRAGLASIGGLGQWQRLYQRLGEVQTSAEPNDPIAVIHSLQQRCGPGSHVLWITRLAFDTLPLIDALRQLASGRRLLIADLLDERLASQVGQPLRDVRTAQAYCLAIQAQGQRDAARECLADAGLEVCSGLAGPLAQAVIRWYAQAASGAGQNGTGASG